MIPIDSQQQYRNKNEDEITSRVLSKMRGRFWVCTPATMFKRFHWRSSNLYMNLLQVFVQMFLIRFFWFRFCDTFSFSLYSSLFHSFFLLLFLLQCLHTRRTVIWIVGKEGKKSWHLNASLMCHSVRKKSNNFFSLFPRFLCKTFSTLKTAIITNEMSSDQRRFKTRLRSKVRW